MTGTGDGLLGPGALKDVRLGVSASFSPSLARLGLLEYHVQLTLGEVARSVLVSGGSLVYGGHLEPDGYTVFLASEVRRYGREPGSLRVCLAWPVHRALPLAELTERDHRLGDLATVEYLDLNGNRLPDYRHGRGERPEPVADPDEQRLAYTNLRRYLCLQTDARLLIGGKPSEPGRVSGLLEEARLTLEHGQPLYLAGGFGGATAAAARALGIDGGDWFPGGVDEREWWDRGYRELAELAGRPQWTGLGNNLTDEENRRLARSFRPSEVASLVSLGLGRRFRNGPPEA
jgi:hypothetical protein